MPKFPKSKGYKMKGFTYPGESPLKIASVSGAQLVQSVGKTYDKYVNYGKLVGEGLKKGFKKHEKPMSRLQDSGEVEDLVEQTDSTKPKSESIKKEYDMMGSVEGLEYKNPDEKLYEGTRFEKRKHKGL